MMRLTLRIRGRVQGVGYRASTYEQARALGLRGWVRNEPDGSVTAVAEGSRAGLESLREFCKQGPPSARVVGIEDEWSEGTGDLPVFEIRR